MKMNGTFCLRSLLWTVLPVLLASPSELFGSGEMHTQCSGFPDVDPFVLFVSLAVICFFIGLFASMGGVGGGVVFTPLFMGFTDMDSYVVRTTGLFIALCGALVAAPAFLRRGIANFRLVLAAALPCAAFSMAGATLAAWINRDMPEYGDSMIRAALGVIVIIIAALQYFAGAGKEYPRVETCDRLSVAMGLFSSSYREESLGYVVRYRVRGTLPGLLMFCGVGFVAGLFGLGGGWAMVPVFNLVMLVPLKVAAACSTTVITFSNTTAVWPYIFEGGMFPLFALPCMAGMISGAMAGSQLMVKTRAVIVRRIVVVFLLVAGTRLIFRAFT